jgi:hypothetical protein
MTLKVSKWMAFPATLLMAGSVAMAQDAASGTPVPATGTQGQTGNTIHERKDNQQERIGKGIENGSLTPGEAARLENKESAINKEIAADRAENGGKLTPQEKQRIDRQQDRLSHDIYQQKHDAQTQHYGNNEVDQRRQNQQERIANGVESGQMTPGEAARAERQQAGINQQVNAERAANGGKLTPGEKAQVNREQNRASRNIYHKKHNARTRAGAN